MKKKVVVVGGGLGGISAAICLQSSSDYQVELYEKNSHLGGKLNLLETSGYSFDLGPSIFTFPYIFQKLFELSGRTMSDYLELVEPEPHWRCFFEDDEQIDLYGDVDKTVDLNSALGTSDSRELKNFLNYSKQLFENVEKGYFKQGADNFWEILKSTGLSKTLFGFDLLSTMHQGVNKRLSNPKLVHIMDFFIKYVGSSPYDAPALLNMIPYGQFQYGLWYVRGGMYNLARALKKLLDELGVIIHLNSEITALKSSRGNIKLAEKKSGEAIEADIIVSNMEVIPTYRELTVESAQTLQQYKRFEPACSGLVLHLGVNQKYDNLAHHNFFFSNDPEKHFADIFQRGQLPDDPTIYLVAPSRTNPDVAPEGCDNIKILPHIPYLREVPFSSRQYAELKQRVFEKLERMGLKNLRDNIVLEDCWTPQDIEQKYYSNHGAIYGVVADRKKNLGFKAAKKSHHYDNLFFVGGSVNPGGGMPMVVLSGQQTAEIIRKQYG